jgi:hypothetical protein
LIDLDTHDAELQIQPQQRRYWVEQRGKRDYEQLPLRIAQTVIHLASQQKASQINPAQTQ